MRDLNMPDFLEVAGAVLKAPPDLLIPRMIDADRAISALMRGGGEPGGGDRNAAVRRCARLFVRLVKVKPSTAGSNEDIAYAAAQKLASNLGYELSLREPASLATAVDADHMTTDQVLREFSTSMRPRSGGRSRIAPDGLAELQGVFSFAISSPSEELREDTNQLCELTRSKLQNAGCTVEVPEPCGHIDRRGRHGNHVHGAEPKRTRDLFELSLGRIVDADFVFSFDDPRGGGSIVERQWAKQLGMPMFNLRMHDVIRPHDDGDGWNITVDFRTGDSVDETANLLVANVHRWSWVVRDYAALRRAYEAKNAATVSYLRAAWESLDKPGRLRVVKGARVADERITAYLSSGVAWELASGRERSAIYVELFAPPEPRGAFYELRPAQITLIAAAGDELGLTTERSVMAASMIARRMALPRTRFDLVNVQQAKIAVRTVLGL